MIRLAHSFKTLFSTSSLLLPSCKFVNLSPPIRKNHNNNNSNSNSTSSTPTQIHPKIQNKIDPVLEFFGITPSGNIFIDMQKLAEAIESDKIDTQVIKMFFDYYDRDENGGIDREEFQLLVRDLGKAISNQALETMNKEDAELIFNTLDHDRNNLISIDEFAAWWKELMQQ